MLLFDHNYSCTLFMWSDSSAYEMQNTTLYQLIKQKHQYVIKRCKWAISEFWCSDDCRAKKDNSWPCNPWNGIDLRKCTTQSVWSNETNLRRHSMNLETFHGIQLTVCATTTQTTMVLFLVVGETFRCFVFNPFLFNCVMVMQVCLSSMVMCLFYSHYVWIPQC